MNLLETYHYYNTELADPRTNNWPLLSSPVPVLLITIAYLYFVLDYGPKYMKNKKPYSLKKFIYAYNLFQIIGNAYLVYSLFDAGWYEDGFMFCTKLDYSYSTNAMKMARLSWHGVLIKLVEYIETIVFVLRKKYRQISFLHLYHHVSTLLLTWLTAKYFANGHSMTVGCINIGIHVMMYTYYLLSSTSPEVQKRLLKIKPIITKAQMGQFVIQILYMMQAFVPGCPGTRIPAAIMMTNLIINFALFYNFYKQNYTSANNKKK